MLAAAARGPRRPWPLVVAVALLVLLSAALVPSAGAAATGLPTGDGVAAQTQTPDEGPPNASATSIRIRLAPDGSARWTVTLRFRLTSANETRAFDRLSAEFRDNGSSVLPITPFREAADAAERATGREMALRSVTRVAGRSNGTGRLQLQFTWTGFTRVDGERIILGDVFRSDRAGEGTWLPRLTEGQELVIVFPPGYAAESSSVGITNGTIQVEGPATFQPGRPSAVLVPESTGVGGTDSPNGTTPPPGLSVGAPGLLAGGVAFVVALAALYLYRRRGGQLGPAGGIPPDDGDGDGGPAGPPEDAGTNEASGGADGPEATTAGDAGPGTEPEPDGEEPLLSDEERVLRLLRSNEGRMKQRRIVEETGWSNAKVSQLLSEMDEAGAIEKLRIGRENLISLPGEAPDEAE